MTPTTITYFGNSNSFPTNVQSGNDAFNKQFEQTSNIISTGQKIGIGIGVTAAVLTIAFVIAVLVIAMRRRKRRRIQQEAYRKEGSGVVGNHHGTYGERGTGSTYIPSGAAVNTPYDGSGKPELGGGDASYRPPGMGHSELYSGQGQQQQGSVNGLQQHQQVYGQGVGNTNYPVEIQQTGEAGRELGGDGINEMESNEKKKVTEMP